MTPPRTLFGFPASWRTGARPQEVGACGLAGITVRALRWELRDVVLQGVTLGSDGHIISFSVDTGARLCVLFQQGGSFYQEEGAERLSCSKKKIAQGDGVSTPRWHKSDREWPVDRGVPLSFIGQCYIGAKVIYLFAHPSTGQFAIFSDDLERQDVEEHYADEERRG
jgi:hypothetical protein